jgi:hypothetical protein
MLHGCTAAFPRKEGWIKVLAGLAPKGQTVKSLLRTPWLDTAWEWKDVACHAHSKPCLFIERAIKQIQIDTYFSNFY